MYQFKPKNGVLPKSLHGYKTLTEVKEEVKLFLAFNKPRTSLPTLNDKIKHYNKHSFYMIELVKE